MPELPEVETIRRQLDEKLRGRQIKSVELFRSGREEPRGRRFVSSLVGRKIKAIERRAKLLIWRFTDGSALIAHLKMTGRFVFVKKDYQAQKHDRALFVFNLPLAKGESEGVWLVWSDVRQFGFLRLFSNSCELENSLSSYGPEPLEATAEELAACLKHASRRSIKAALLDQTVIAGVGNIYADEALHRAGLRPTRKMGELSGKERLYLVEEIQNVLCESLAKQGTSANDYVDTRGEKGGFFELLRVYGRAGQACRKCQQPIKKIVLAQRGTHYCPKCQR